MTEKFMICEASVSQAAAAAQLAAKLWSHHTAEDLIADVEKTILSENCAVFLGYQNRTPVGFAQCSLRHDYVEGTDSSPVGYLEGIFVEPACRANGLARELLLACEAWAKANGCTEFASDCELHNTDSLQFHLKVGFCEVNRIICFTKPL